MRLPRPSDEEIQRANDFWENSDELRLTEDALDKLFKDYPTNEDVTQILIKVLALDKALGIKLFQPVKVAKHIKARGIDDLLNCNSDKAVEDIRVGHSVRNRRGTEINLYSFATKYCYFHKTHGYHLHDSNVLRALSSFRTEEGFYFTGNLRGGYQEFRKAVQDFIECYDLQKIDNRSLDHYLYLAGRVLDGDRTITIWDE